MSKPPRRRKSVNKALLLKPGLKSTEFGSLVAIVLINIITLMVTLGKISPERGDVVSNAVLGILAAIGTIASVFGYKCYNQGRVSVKRKIIQAKVDNTALAFEEESSSSSDESSDSPCESSSQ